MYSRQHPSPPRGCAARSARARPPGPRPAARPRPRPPAPGPTTSPAPEAIHPSMRRPPPRSAGRPGSPPTRRRDPVGPSGNRRAGATAAKGLPGGPATAGRTGRRRAGCPGCPRWIRLRRRPRVPMRPVFDPARCERPPKGVRAKSPSFRTRRRPRRTRPVESGLHSARRAGPGCPVRIRAWPAIRSGNLHPGEPVPAVFSFP